MIDPERKLNDVIADKALEYVGRKACRYRNPDWGLSDETGYDCSGLVVSVLKEVGFPGLSGIRHSNEFSYKFGKPVHWNFRRRGDIPVITRGGIRENHVGIITDVDMLSGGTIIIESLAKECLNPSPKDSPTIRESVFKPQFLNQTPAELTVFAQNLVALKRPAIELGRVRFSNFTWGQYQEILELIDTGRIDPQSYFCLEQMKQNVGESSLLIPFLEKYGNSYRHNTFLALSNC